MEDVRGLAIAALALVGCGRIGFSLHDRSDAPSETADAPPGCWSTPIDVSQNVGASFGPSLASDGTALYVAWADATGYVHDPTTGTENLMFRRVELDGSLAAPVVEIPKSVLGTNRNQFPNLLVHGGAIVLTYTGQAGTSVDSDGQARHIVLDTTGTAVTSPVVISDDITAPNPGVTGEGYTHELVYVPELDQLLHSAFGKYPWGGNGAWNRSAYFVDPATGGRVGTRVCFDNCGGARTGHTAGSGRAIYRPAPEDWVAFLQTDNNPYGSSSYQLRFRRIDRTNAQLGSDVVIDSITGAPTFDAMSADFAWSSSLGRYVAIWVMRTPAGMYEVRSATLDAQGNAGAVTVLGSFASPASTVRILPLSSGGYFALLSTATALSMLELDAAGAVARPLAQIEALGYGQDSMIEQGGRVIVATDEPTSGEVYLHCYLP